MNKVRIVCGRKYRIGDEFVVKRRYKWADEVWYVEGYNEYGYHYIIQERNVMYLYPYVVYELVVDGLYESIVPIQAFDSMDKANKFINGRRGFYVIPKTNR